MMTNSMATVEEQSDAELVSCSLGGDRDAFRLIVSRYQTLICSLAYSRIGNLSQSEDIAQETFITAWKHLRLLREPAKLRAWLCGIVRNRIHKNLRREGRDPAHNAESLEIVHDLPANEVIPSEEAVSREEEAILWRSLEKVPGNYREPLILFYRKHQSVEAVAEELELSEDAVKQRLSRGRKLLQEEVQAFVEKTLRRSVPSQAFSGAVLAALPAGPATTVGTSAVGAAAAAKSGFVGAWLAPIIGILGGITAHWLIARSAPTPRERRLKKFGFIGLWAFVLAWCIPGQLGLLALSAHRGWSDLTFFRVMAGFWWFYAVVLATGRVLMFRRVSAIRRKDEESIGTSPSTGKPPTVISRVAVVVGIPLACFSWLIGLALQAHDHASVGIIVGVMMSLTIWNLVRLRGKTGTTAARAVATYHAIVGGTILAILNFRLESWLASLHQVGIAEIRQRLPLWIIPLLTLSVVAWVCLLLRLTSPKRSTAEALPKQTCPMPPLVSIP
jgi:RNA polymerase sigma factor (sigma-70 family)